MYRGEPEFDLMFYKLSGLSARRVHVERCQAEVDGLSEAEMSALSDEQILEKLMHRLSVTIPTLDRENITFEREIAQVQGQNHWGEQVVREIVVFYFDVPFSGDSEIFNMQPSTSDLNPPRGEVRRDRLKISVVGEEDPAKLKAEVDSTLATIDKYLAWHRETWAGVDDELARSLRSRLNDRRQKLTRLGNAEAGLASMGFKPKNG